MKLTTYQIHDASFEQLTEWEKQVLLDVATIQNKIESFHDNDGVSSLIKEKTRKALRHNQRNLNLLRTFIAREQRNRDKLEKIIQDEKNKALKVEKARKHKEFIAQSRKAKEERIEKNNQQQRERNELLIQELRKMVTHEQFLQCCEKVTFLMSQLK